MHRWIRGFCATALLLLGASCEVVDRVRDRTASTDTAGISASAGGLTLGLQTPGVLRPGEDGVIRLSLANRGDSVPRGMRLDLLVPAWMEPLPPRPGDREVTLSASAEEGTRFSYRLDDPPVEPGQAQIVEQRVRVPSGSPVVSGASPWSRRVRARLVSPGGEPLAQVESEIALPGAAGDTSGAAPGGPAPPADRLGPVRLGMTADAVRQAAPGARDTTWAQEGMQESGLVVPLEGGGRAVALLVGDTVQRIEVRDSVTRTPEGLGVGSTLERLRAAHGRACAGVGEGVVVVWFPAAPGTSFALDTPVREAMAGGEVDPARLPATARVTGWWIRRGTDACP